MAERESMTYEEAVGRIVDRELPDFWVGDADVLADRLAAIERGTVEELAESPGGRPIRLVTYGEREPLEPAANFNSAVAAADPAHYADRTARERPVVLLLGPVHGAEVEGLTGLCNLLQVMETGADLGGTPRPGLRELGEQCRLLVIPEANPDGLARVDPRTLQGMELADLRFWGQGTWADDRFMGWPGAKRRHPMVGDEVGFVGGYFDDDGVNPMHDEFFDPIGPEAPAVLDLAREEAPDVAVSLHSHASPPTILRPAYLPAGAQRAVRSIAADYEERLEARDLPAGDVFEVSAEDGSPPPYFNLVSALYHTSGARSFVHECPHGLAGEEWCAVDLAEILEIQLAFYESILDHAVSNH